MVKVQSAVALAIGLLLASQAAADEVRISGNRSETAGAAFTEWADGSVRLRIDDSKDAALTLYPPEADQGWDLSRWDVLAMDVENLSAQKQTRLVLSLHSDAERKQDASEINTGIALNPGEKRTLRIKLLHRWKYASPDGVPGVKSLDTQRVTAMKVTLQWPFEPAQQGLLDCRISNVRTERPLEPTEPFTHQTYVPFIDAYGQNVHADYEAKIHSNADIQAVHQAEVAELKASTRPASWNRFGGWKDGPQLEATGHFRTARHDGRWYLVDPEGRLFFSQGMDVVSHFNDPLKVMPGREDWFQNLPAGAKIYQPTEIALQVKYGQDYKPAYFEHVQRRLEHWGMNTLGDWSRAELMELGGTPYTLQLTDFDWKMPRLGASKLKFYDVFDQRYVEKMTNLFAWATERNPIVAKSINDPMCIGYFIDNELDFGNRDGKLAFVDEVLRTSRTQAAKLELVRDLQEKYTTIEALNQAWETSHGSWDEMLDSTTIPATSAYREDSAAFLAKAVDRYFQLCRDAVKSVAPHRLYLGTRFISTDSVRPVLYRASQKYCDVLTVNIYAHSAANFPSPAFVSPDYPDMPVLIGEFHFGVFDRGLFSGSLCTAGLTQADRALAYTRFMQGAIAHPNIVGAHWFQYRDQPLTGRGDGEAYPIGFVDITDTPYREMHEASRRVGEKMYTWRANGTAYSE